MVFCCVDWIETVSVQPSVPPRVGNAFYAEGTILRKNEWGRASQMRARTSSRGGNPYACDL
jgi:hypothetical protein